jgi:hypothetical protein
MSDTNVTIQDSIINVSIVETGIDVSVVDTETITVDVQDETVMVEVVNSPGTQGPTGPVGPGVPSGGTQGQIIVKNSATNYDTGWSSQNVVLGEYGVSAGYLQLDTTPTQTPAIGRFIWDDTNGTADLLLKGGQTTLKVGQQQIIRVVNKTGANLLDSQYKAVRIRKVSEGGAQGQRLAVVLAQGSNENQSTDVMGIVTENIDNNQDGFIVTFGNVENINTTGSLQGETWLDGDILFLSPTVPGGLTKVKPSAPDHLVIMGYVEYAHQNNGKLFVKVQTSFEIEELHNVSAQNPSDGDVLQYVSSTGLWTKTSSINFGTW